MKHLKRPAAYLILGVLSIALPSYADDAACDAPPLFDGLGSHSRQVTTKSPEAQKYFNQGLAFLYAFNHDEAIRSFEYATKLDPTCVMAWWGVANANGPHINNPLVPPERASAAWKALSKAQEHAEDATPIENALLAASLKRFAAEPNAERRPLDEAYAVALRELWKGNPTDADVGAMFAESLMNLRPWDLWTPEGQPQPGTEEVVATLEAVLTQNPNHPLALHLYIHAVEASPQPEKAIAPSDRLRTLQPGLGHMVHMPSHIDVRTGRWKLAVESNQNAIVADQTYRARSPRQEFYRIYMAHNHHMLAYAAMMRGQSKLAIDAINDMAGAMPPEWVKANPLFADGFTSMPLEVLVRFGKWDEILASPEPPEYLPFTSAMHHVARGIAYAAKGQTEEARQEEKSFRDTKEKVLPEARVGNNSAADVLAVAESLLAGEILIREGKIDEGLLALREAVTVEDKLRYSEPPDWIHPVRHALGATLLALDKPAEAEAVYREDLVKLPNNGWSLLGMSRAFDALDRETDSQKYEQLFAEVWKDADVKISSSCACQPGKLVAD